MNRTATAAAVVLLARLKADGLVPEEGFDDAGVQTWGPKAGTIGHVFRKRPAGPFLGK